MISLKILNKKGAGIVLAVLIIVTSCKPREKIIRTDPDRNVDLVALRNTLDNRKEHIQTLRFSKVKFNLKLDEDDYKMGGTIGLIKDSIIVISIIPLMGYEMARIYCTSDSILVINRTDKNFYKLGLKDELRKYNLSADYEILQSILMNSYFIYTEGIQGRFHESNLVFREGEYLVNSKEEIKDKLIFEQEQVIDATHFGIKSIAINDYVRKEMIKIDYDSFNDYEDIYLPGNILLISSIRNYSLSLEINIGDIEVNETINAGVRIPAKYKRQIL